MLLINYTLRITIILIVAFSVFSTRCVAQEDLKSKVGKVFELIYDYKLISADSSISMYEKQHPDHPVWPLLRANVAWWQILSGRLDDQQLNKKFLSQLNASKARAKSFDGSDDEAAFSLIIVNAFRTRFDLLHNNYLTAAGYLNACIDDISDSFGREPEYEPYYLTSGLYYYFMQEAHDDYPLMRPYLFFFPNGDREKGLAYLSRCAKSSDIFLREEATYFLMRIALDLEKQPEQALVHLNKLLKRYPDNVIFRLFEVDIYKQLGQTEKGLDAELLYRTAVNRNEELSLEQKTYFKELLNKQKKAPK